MVYRRSGSTHKNGAAFFNITVVPLKMCLVSGLQIRDHDTNKTDLKIMGSPLLPKL
jgi:hypothetical protein